MQISRSFWSPHCLFTRVRAMRRMTLAFRVLGMSTTNKTSLRSERFARMGGERVF